VHVALAAHRLLAQAPGGVGDDAEQQQPPFELRAVGLAADVHRDRVDGVRPLATGVAQAGADRVEPAQLGDGPEDAGAVVEAQGRAARAHGEAGVEAHARVLTKALTVAHSLPSPAPCGRIV
jgi:hypothetical protein